MDQSLLLLLLSGMLFVPNERDVQTENDDQQEQSMVDGHQALTLSSHHDGNMTEIIVKARTDDHVQVNYELAVSGENSTRHAGSTQLSPGPEHVLSRVRIARSDRWCATLDVEQGDGLTYRLVNGPC